MYKIIARKNISSQQCINKMLQSMDNVLFILVLYKMRAEESPAWQALRQFCSDEEMKKSVFIHDNTIHNIYLAEPYNLGVQKAKEQNKQFIVLLDQDTILTQEYLEKVKEISLQKPKNPKVYVPLLKDSKGQISSPFIVSELTGFSVYKPYSQTLLPKQFLGALNSCTIIDIGVFDKIGQFDTRFQLDSLDHWFFYMCYKFHIPIEVIQVALVHQVSTVGKVWNISTERYISILTTREILSKEIGIGAILFNKKWLLGQILKWIRRGKSEFLKLALQYFFR